MKQNIDSKVSGFALIVLSLFSINANAQIIINFAGRPGITDGYYCCDSEPATSAGLDPYSVAVDTQGNVYIADYSNSRIRKVDVMTGIITTIAGNGIDGYSGDGGQADSAELGWPNALAVDISGNIYIVDGTRIRKVDVMTGIITTIAGNGIDGYSGDGGQADSAELNYPSGVGIDPSGNVYIADKQNGRIRKVDATTGIITTFAGNDKAGYSGDGGLADTTELNYPNSITFDASGNAYIADTYNNRIRKVDAATGIITTFAGEGGWSYPESGISATDTSIPQPYAITADISNNIYFSISFSVWKISATTGLLSNIAGDATQGYSGDGGPAIDAKLWNAAGLTIDRSDNIYIADEGDFHVRKVTNGTTGINNLLSNRNEISVYPNPSNGNFYFNGVQIGYTIEVYNLLGEVIYSGKTNADNYGVNITGQAKGIYFYRIINNTAFIKEGKVIIQ